MFPYEMISPNMRVKRVRPMARQIVPGMARSANIRQSACPIGIYLPSADPLLSDICDATYVGFANLSNLKEEK